MTSFTDHIRVVCLAVVAAVAGAADHPGLAIYRKRSTATAAVASTESASIVPAETGVYEFVGRTEHSAKLVLNTAWYELLANASTKLSVIASIIHIIKAPRAGTGIDSR